MDGTLNTPASLDRMLRRTPSRALVTVTTAEGTATPVASVTTPAIAP